MKRGSGCCAVDIYCPAASTSLSDSASYITFLFSEWRIDIIAPNKTFLNKKLNFCITGYDTVRNDRSTGQKGGVAFLVKHSLVINKEYRNSDFNIITENFKIKTSLWQRFTARMEILTFHFSNPLITSLMIEQGPGYKNAH